MHSSSTATLPAAQPQHPRPALRQVLAVFHDAGRAGAELVLLHHLTALHAQGVKIAAVLPRRGPLLTALAPLNPRLYFHAAPWWIRLHGSRTHARAWDDTARGGLGRRLHASVRVLERICVAEQPDCVLTAASVLLSPALAARARRIPSLQFIHEWPGGAGDPSSATTPAAADGRFDSPLAWADSLALLRNLNHRLLWSSPACALAWQDPGLPFRATPAELHAAWQTRSAGPEAREQFLAHPIDLTAYPASHTPTAGTRPAAAPAAPLRLACVATWAWRKGLDLLPPLLDHLHAAQQPFTLTLVGHVPKDGYTRKLRRRLAAAPWAAQVTCLPYADHLPALFAGTDLLLHPAREDTSPLILAHALAAGVPIVAADLPGIRELLAGYAGPAETPAATLLPPADLAAWQAWLLHTAQTWHTPAEAQTRRAQTARGQALARRSFDAAAIQAQLLNAIAAAHSAAQTQSTDVARADGLAVAPTAPTAAAALWAWRDEALDLGRGLIARLAP